MNLLLLTRDELCERPGADSGPAVAREALLTGERARHIREILGAVPGSVLRVGEEDGGVGVGEVIAVDHDAVRLAVRPLARQTLERPYELVLALPRPQMLKRILEHSASCGFRSVTLIGAGRVEQSYFHSPLLSPAGLRKHLLLGAEQGGVTQLPEVTILPRFHEFLKRLDASATDELRVVADRSFPHTLEAAVGSDGRFDEDSGEKFGAERRVRFAIGPEGGWRKEELDSFVDRGFIGFNLGPFVLRVETAVSVVWGQLSLLRDRFRNRISAATPLCAAR